MINRTVYIIEDINADEFSYRATTISEFYKEKNIKIISPEDLMKNGYYYFNYYDSIIIDPSYNFSDSDMGEQFDKLLLKSSIATRSDIIDGLIKNDIKL